MESWTEKYINTLWFITVTKMITVIVLMLLAFPFSKPFFPLLLTLEIGLVVVIAWALLRMYLTKNNMNKQYSIMQDTIMTNASCPDYFTRGSNEKAETICYNKYVTPDNKRIYYFTDPSNNSTDLELNASINLDALFRDKFQNVCAGPLSNKPMYRKIPWTDVKPLCDDDVDSTFLPESEEDQDDEDASSSLPNYEYKLPKEFYE